MLANLGYHSLMKRFQRPLVVGLAVLALGLIPASGQVHGVPASVTSIGFGGHAGPHGVPPSVTSIGPKGLAPNNQFPTPGTCCINPLAPSKPYPNPGNNGHHHRRDYGYGGYAYAVPYAVPYYADDPNAAEAASPDDQYNGGPTIFDRRGDGQPAPYQMSQYAPPSSPAQPAAQASDGAASDQPQTVLVFKDGHQIEVSNYAIVGSTLFDLTPGHARRVPLADLNLQATSQQNDSLGIDFQLPGSAGTN